MAEPNTSGNHANQIQAKGIYSLMTDADRLKAKSTEQLRDVVCKSCRAEELAGELMNVISNWRATGHWQTKASQAGEVAAEKQEAVTQAQAQRQAAIDQNGPDHVSYALHNNQFHPELFWHNQHVEQVKQQHRQAKVVLDTRVFEMNTREALGKAAMDAVLERQNTSSADALKEIREAPDA